MSDLSGLQSDGREDEGTLSAQPAPAPLARHGRRTHRLSGPAGAGYAIARECAAANGPRLPNAGQPNA